MRFCYDNLRNLGVIGIAMTLRNIFSFKLNLYFIRYMHVNTKNKTQAPKIFFIFDLSISAKYVLTVVKSRTNCMRKNNKF